MRYWAYLAAKLLAVALGLRYLWLGIALWVPKPRIYRNHVFGHDLTWTFVTGLFFLICCGAVYLCVLEQRYRCRVCLRRLRMPVATGSWGQMLQFGRPRVEYICPFGHGTLKVPALQISGIEAADWERHDDDIWKELAGNGEDRR